MLSIAMHHDCFNCSKFMINNYSTRRWLWMATCQSSEEWYTVDRYHEDSKAWNHKCTWWERRRTDATAANT